MNESSREFDRRLASRHTYLGDFEEITSSTTHLDPFTKCSLPVLAIQGVVLMPGVVLPLCLFDSDTAVVELALKASTPYTGLIAVVNDDEHSFARHSTGTASSDIIACTAQLRQIHRAADICVKCLAIGRQQCRITRIVRRNKVEVEVLQGSCLQAPYEARDHVFAAPAWTFHLCDARRLQKIARAAYASSIPNVPQPDLDPVDYSYWLASNLPLHHSIRRGLLGITDTSCRLGLLIKLLNRAEQFQCRRCWRLVAEAKHLLAMSEMGAGNVCVNAYGYTHELLTVTKVGNVDLEGGPETSCSWFPGYAWIIARCSTCGSQLGWKFTSTDACLQPKEFWGVRTQAITIPNPD